MLTENVLQEILADWSFWEEASPPQAVIRDITLPKKLNTDLALIIQGVRRCGKSTLMTQLPRHYQLDLEHCYYCNFEDPRLLGMLNHQLLSSIVKLAHKRSGANKQCYFFFDEIQNVQDWEKWLHTQLERPKHNHFILSGSNSALLSGEFGSSVTGRHLTLELFPFNFTEYKTLFPKKKLEAYIQSGGFPRPLVYEDPPKLLQEYFNDIILRDVLRRVNARSADAIKQVVKMTFESCGSELSYRKIAAVVGSNVDTVKSYLEGCEQAYILFECPYFAFSEKKQQSRNKKFYPIDPGLCDAVTTSGSANLGKHLETLVFLRLKQQFGKVYYWRDDAGEVDFLTLDGKIPQPYQVTWDTVQTRHQKALDAFYQAFPQAKEPIFITKENAEEFI